MFTILAQHGAVQSASAKALQPRPGHSQTVAASPLRHLDQVSRTFPSSQVCVEDRAEEVKQFRTCRDKLSLH